MSDMTLEVEPREAGGKNVNRRLRAAGKVPAVVYGGGIDPATIQVDTRAMRDLMRGTADDNPVFLLKLAGTDKSRHTMIREMQADPISGELIHIDFLRVSMDEDVTVTVQINLVGTPLGVKNEDGMVDFVTREVSVTCLPNKIPGHIDIDIAGLHVGQHLEASDLQMPEGVTLEEDPDRVVVSVASKAIAEPVESEDDDDVQPKVISKGKDEDDDED